jgi:hypothetical protein
MLSVRDLITLRGVCKSTFEIIKPESITKAITQGRLGPELRTNFYVHQVQLVPLLN